MLNRKRQSLAGKLLLSSALVAVSLAYGWWQRHNVVPSQVAMMPVPPAPRPVSTMPRPEAPAIAAPTAPAPTTAEAGAGAAGDAPRDASEPSVQAKAAPAAPKSTITAMAPAKAPEPAATPAALPPQGAPPPTAPAASPALSAQAALEMYLPTEEASPPLAAVTGTPAAGTLVPTPTGTHLEDGDYLSDRHQFEWGDLKVKISVRGGQITGVQIVQYPDHRSQSLYLSQMAGPVLESEVIKAQQAQVDVVSSATDTSYAFQDTIANAIMKATRG